MTAKTLQAFPSARLFMTGLLVIAATTFCLLSSDAFAAAGGYKKATEGDDVVKNKLYPKKGKLELNGPNFGKILNQSYVDTYIVNAGVNYFWSEVWGLGLDFSYAINQDREERDCIENFYNDPEYQISKECGGSDNLPGGDSKANYGPAYVNIREYNYLFSGSMIWNPIYGKEIFFLSAVGYFDVYTVLGGGLASTTFYPMTKELNNGKESRNGTNVGADPSETDSYGKEGRPAAIQESKVFIQGGIGQKFHFGKAFNFKIELRDHIVVGTPGGFDMFFTLWGGAGFRF